MKSILCSVLFVLVSVILATAQGTYTQIDYPGASATGCFGINEAGETVGYYNDTSGKQHGFLLSAGVFTTIDSPGASGTVLDGLNNVGQVIGVTSSPSSAFVYDRQTQTFTPIAFKGTTLVIPSSISDSGIVAGWFDPPGNVEQAGFELIAGRRTLVNVPGASSTVVSGRSTSGKLAGYYSSSNGTLNFIFESGRYRQLEIPNAPLAEVFGINPAGTAVVGQYISQSLNVGFVYQSNTLQTLLFPGSIYTEAYGINTAGEVVGAFGDTFVQHCFTWTPSADAATK
ncbi:MAG TPA: hypothetical protein VFA68_08665 [Terriglobales bacterium]|nr:hypothetical protein [Terriglobales bacterium]